MPISTISTINVTMHTEPGEPTGPRHSLTLYLTAVTCPLISSMCAYMHVLAWAPPCLQHKQLSASPRRGCGEWRRKQALEDGSTLGRVVSWGPRESALEDSGNITNDRNYVKQKAGPAHCHWFSTYLSLEMLQSMTVFLLVLMIINGNWMVEFRAGGPWFCCSFCRFLCTRFLKAICCKDQQKHTQTFNVDKWGGTKWIKYI